MANMGVFFYQIPVNDRLGAPKPMWLGEMQPELQSPAAVAAGQGTVLGAREACPLPAGIRPHQLPLMGRSLLVIFAAHSGRDDRDRPTARSLPRSAAEESFLFIFMGLPRHAQFEPVLTLPGSARQNQLISQAMTLASKGLEEGAMGLLLSVFPKSFPTRPSHRW